MSYWYEGILLYIATVLVHSYGVDPAKENCLAFESDYHIHKACECVVYQSYGLSQGRFHSPNYPNYYKPGINCILFTFIGDVNEIVEINFMDLDLKAPLTISPTHHICKDRIRIFQNLERPEVNEDSIWDREICGNISNLSQKKFYSEGRGLILEFHTDQDSRESHIGFRGIYTFLDKNIFKTDGVSLAGSQCLYHFQSDNNRTKGNFYSPRYPQNYPKGSDCHYMFFGHQQERVYVKFKNIQLHHTGKRNHRHSSHNHGCLDSHDKIIVYDGKDSSQRILKTFCDSHNLELVNSSGPYLYIEFRSDRRHERQGFAAEYHFIDKDSYFTIGDSGGTSGSEPGQSFICNEVKSSEVKKNGTVFSPRYPSPYPSSIICQYEFEGVGQERVQIRFLDMNLHYTGRDPADPYDCTSQDRISVVVFVAGKEEELGTYCGQKTPPQLMSNGVKMKVIFRSESSQKSGVSGFKLEYSFRTDFGVISTGRQDTRGDLKCKYIFNSNITETGTFTSPNFPGKYPHEFCTFMFHSNVTPQGRFTSPNIGGQYPRNTECRYIFDGKSTERVEIRFLQFDVDGILPRCDDTTKSDSVTFSNFLNSEDRKMPRFCGKKPGHPSVKSDGAFFRVTFKSNHIYDAKGFKAEYAFQRVMDEQMDRQMNGQGQGYIPFQHSLNADEYSTVTPVQQPQGGVRSGSSNYMTVAMVMMICLCQTVINHVL